MLCEMDHLLNKSLNTIFKNRKWTSNNNMSMSKCHSGVMYVVTGWEFGSDNQRERSDLNLNTNQIENKLIPCAYLF